jgi:geranylgeranyl diphosphate synthase type I
LIAASVQAGAMLATDDPAIIDAYRGFGWSLGLAFQLNDDLLGIWGDEELTGKEPSDLAKHKKTLPVIYALERAPADEGTRLREILAMSAADNAAIQEARGIIERCGAREYTRERAHAERDVALERLASAGVVGHDALERLRAIVVSAISA